MTTTTLCLALRNGWVSLLTTAAVPGRQADGSAIYRVTDCPVGVDPQRVLARFFGYWLDAAPFEMSYAELSRRSVPDWLLRAG